MTDTAALLKSLRDAASGAPRLYIPGGPAEPTFLADAFRTDPALADGVTFLGHWLPGINHTDWAGLHPNAAAEGTFLYSDHRRSFEAGRFRLLPLHYSEAFDWLKSVPLDAALRIERKALQLLMSSEDKAEGIASFLEKRPPVFRGR